MSGVGRPCGAPPGMGNAQDCATAPGDDNSNGSVYWGPPVARSAAVVNSKIMVVAVAVLFAVVLFILCLHVYAKWFWRSQGVADEQPGQGDGQGQARTGSWRRRRRDSRLRNASQVVLVQSVGLEKAVIEALPTFEFARGDTKLGPGALECAVCLEDFEHGEKGRTLPKCGHHFHLDCVDMWLYSHSTCPLCRAGVRPEEFSKPTNIAPVDDHNSQPRIIGDVQAPFMAAMRASRSRQRTQAASPAPLPSNPISHLVENPNATPTLATSEPHEAAPTPAAVDPKALAIEHHSITAPTQPGPQPSASSIRAPFQITIDIPRAPSLHPANVMSPMARASASFRRLISRGKSEVSPHDNDSVDEGSPSS